MKDRRVLAIVAVILTPVILALWPGRALADFGDNSSDPDGSIALAERFATFAHQTFHQGKIPQRALQLDAALYRAAVKLNPNEPRFSRALADIMLEMKDVPGATDALRKYMALVPSDQSAQVQFIDLCLASDQMQSLDQRLSYLRSLLQKQQIPGPVKSEIAYRAAQLLMDRGQDEEARKLLDSALQLNPLNLKVLRIRYSMTQATALPVDRVQQLLKILEANPSDAVVASRLAEQLARTRIGRSPRSRGTGWPTSFTTRPVVRADPAFVLGASSELLLAKHAEDAARLAAKYTTVLPEDADGWFVVLSVLKFQLSLYHGPANADGGGGNRPKGLDRDLQSHPGNPQDDRRHQCHHAPGGLAHRHRPARSFRRCRSIQGRPIPRPHRRLRILAGIARLAGFVLPPRCRVPRRRSSTIWLESLCLTIRFCCGCAPGSNTFPAMPPAPCPSFRRLAAGDRLRGAGRYSDRGRRSGHRTAGHRQSPETSGRSSLGRDRRRALVGIHRFHLMVSPARIR